MRANSFLDSSEYVSITVGSKKGRRWIPLAYLLDHDSVLVLLIPRSYNTRFDDREIIRGAVVLPVNRLFGLQKWTKVVRGFILFLKMAVNG